MDRIIYQRKTPIGLEFDWTGQMGLFNKEKTPTGLELDWVVRVRLLLVRKTL